MSITAWAIKKTPLATGNSTQYTYDAENRLIQVQDFAAGNPTAITISSYRYDGLGRRIEKVANGQTIRYVYDGEDILLEYNGSNVLQARYTHGPGIDEPLSRTPMVPGLSSGQTAVLASTPDGLRGPVVDDGIKVNGQVSVGFVFVFGMPAPAIGQPIDSTGLEQPIAPIDVTAAAATGALAVDLIDTGGIGGNAPLYLVTRDQATSQVIESRLLFPARATFASTTPLGTPLVVASATVPTTTPVADGTLYYHQDGLGTVTELTDTNGSVAKAYAYDAYGNILESPGTVEQPYTYTGRELDSETGLYYYRARYYDATTGRFLQQDPLKLGGGSVNLYGYVLNSPANFVDPSGLFLERFFCGARNGHNNTSISADEFVEHVGSRSLRDLQYEYGSANVPESEAGGPNQKQRYVRDPADPNSVIDMRHFLVVGKQGELFGLGVEIGQALSSNPDARSSAFDPQDFYSNALGANFFASADPSQNFRDQLRRFFAKRKHVACPLDPVNSCK